MVEVLKLFNCSVSTLFLSIKIMDYYFKCQTRPLHIEDLHVTGVVSMFIASKYSDKTSLKMHSIYTKIGHQALPKAQIKRVEIEILRTINYSLCMPTVCDFLENFTEGVSQEERDKAFLLAELAQLDYYLAGVNSCKLARAIVFNTPQPLAGVIRSINLNGQSNYLASLKKYNII